jgi:hypothetical protein
MRLNLGRALAALCLAGVLLGVWAIPASAQAAAANEKPRLYTYAAYWSIPRARWEDMAKAGPANQKIFDGAARLDRATCRCAMRRQTGARSG